MWRTGNVMSRGTGCSSIGMPVIRYTFIGPGRTAICSDRLSTGVPIAPLLRAHRARGMAIRYRHKKGRGLGQGDTPDHDRGAAERAPRPSSAPGAHGWAAHGINKKPQRVRLKTKAKNKPTTKRCPVFGGVSCYDVLNRSGHRRERHAETG